MRWWLTAAILLVSNAAPRAWAAPASAPPASSAPADVDDAAFWSWFSKHAADLAKLPLVDAMTQIGDALEKKHPGLIAEIGAPAGGRLLVLSADGNRKLFPAVLRVYAARPAHIPGWSVVAFRQREKGRPLSTIGVGGQAFDPVSIRFLAKPDGDQLQVVLFVPGYTPQNVEALQPAFIALDMVLGEYDVETRIGAMDFQPLDKAPKNALPLDQLAAQVDALPRVPSPSK